MHPLFFSFLNSGSEGATRGVADYGLRYSNCMLGSHGIAGTPSRILRQVFGAVRAFSAFRGALIISLSYYNLPIY